MPFVKGKSGNPSGRPAKAKADRDFVASLSETVGDLKPGESSKQFLERALLYYANMMEKSSKKEEIENYLKMGTDVANKLIGYEKPRISSVDSMDSRPSEVTVTWKEPEAIPEDHPMKKYMDDIKT